jgi:hypothetical protein
MSFNKNDARPSLEASKNSSDYVEAELAMSEPSAATELKHLRDEADRSSASSSATLSLPQLVDPGKYTAHEVRPSKRIRFSKGRFRNYAQPMVVAVPPS